MRLVTVATHSGGYFKYLQQSCERHGAKLEVLGWKQRWRGFQWRFQLMNEYLKSLHDDEVVCFIDSFDVILLRPLSELETLFRSVAKNIGAKIIVGCENNSSAFQRIGGNYIFGSCQKKYLNAGTYIGFARDLKRITDQMMAASSNPGSDDQIMMTQVCNQIENQGDFHIDCDNMFFITHCNMFGNFLNSQMKVVNEQLMVNGSRPFFAHGSANTNMRDLLAKFGYHVSPAEVKRLQAERASALRKKVLYFSKFFIVPAILLIAIVTVAILLLQNRRL